MAFPWWMLIPLVTRLVVIAERLIRGKGRGQEKKKLVLEGAKGAVEVLEGVGVFRGRRGPEHDEALSRTVDNVVDLWNNLGWPGEDEMEGG